MISASALAWMGKRNSRPLCRRSMHSSRTSPRR
nr:MAG TPA: hypothetical protein [Bacteriophage sp.]